MKKSVALAICFFLLGIVAFYLFDKHNEDEAAASGEKRQGGYALINPLLECNNGESLSNKKFASLKNSAVNVIEQAREKGHVNRVSVYYRDLNNGPWFGINEKEKFAPASLLKVPVMMAYLKEAETNPSVLKSKIITRESDFSIEQNVTSDQTIQPDKEYTVEELIVRMIDLSDNYSFNVLVNKIGPDKIDRIHSDLAINSADLDSPENYISVKTYSSLFRVLYNSSYLNRSMSEKALDILTKTTFSDGISAGLPAEIVVAHKFGVREYADSSEKQLHDCGIIYSSMNPYLLCVMTSGDDLKKQTDMIAEISKIIYEGQVQK